MSDRNTTQSMGRASARLSSDISSDEIQELVDHVVLLLSDAEHCARLVATTDDEVAPALAKNVTDLIFPRLGQLLDLAGCDPDDINELGHEIFNRAMDFREDRAMQLRPSRGSA